MYRPKVVTLTIENILSKVSEEAIFAYFLGISEYDIAACLDTSYTIFSPFRVERSPSTGFYTAGNGRIYCQDFGGEFHGDCFDAVADKEHIRRPLDGAGLMKALEIVRDKLISTGLADMQRQAAHSNRAAIKATKRETWFDIVQRNWNHFDYKYWMPQGITEAQLNRFNVIPLQELWINDRLAYCYRVSDPAYAYDFGLDKTNKPIYTVYYPLRKKGLEVPRFQSNHHIAQGGKLVTPHDIGIITKSYKDVILLSNYEDTHSIQGIAPPSERTLLSVSQVAYLRTKWKQIYTFADFDRTGRLFGLRMKRLHGIEPLFLTNGIGDTINFLAKDPTDYVRIFGKSQFDALVNFVYLNGYASVHTQRFKDFCMNELKHDDKYTGHNLPF